MLTFAQRQSRSPEPASSRHARPDAAGRAASPHPGITASPPLGHDLRRIPIHPPAAAAVRTKLAINARGDESEREADRLSEQVMRMPEPGPRHACACGGVCPRCRASQHGLGRGIVQPMRMGTGGARETALPPVVDEALRSPAQALDPRASRFFGPRFGHDFAGVRVHADARAAESARALNARAYTVGRDVVFARGEYQPATPGGRRLLAHELAHVVQQSGAAARCLQAKVDEAEYVPCRNDPTRSAAVVGEAEEEAARMAEAAVPFLRARPIAEETRRLLWKKFRLDYNDPLVRCRNVPEIADRLAKIAREIRTEEIHYGCDPVSEPSRDCIGHWAVTRARGLMGRPYRIDLCTNFWRDKEDRGLTLLHEWAHFEYQTRGVKDAPSVGFNNAACYSAFALEVTGKPSNAIEDEKCGPWTDEPPPLDSARVAESCPSNVFVNLSVTGGYTRGLPVRGDALGARLDLHFPLTRMHDRELSLGAQFQRFAPPDPTDRAAFLFGIRAGFHVRDLPGRGWQTGIFAEGGGLSLPGPTGDRVHPYAGGGLTIRKNVPLGRRKALQIFVDVGGRIGFDTHDSRRFGWFESGMGIALQHQ